jgi:hypothetical protein
MAKNKELYDLMFEVLGNSFRILEAAEIKKSSTMSVIRYLRSQSLAVELPDNMVVHWSSAQLELITSHTIALTRAALLAGKEVNRMRMGQRRPIKDFIKEAQQADEYESLLAKRKEERDAYKGTEE